MLQKIFPGGVGSSPRHSFKVVFLSEGYLAHEQHLFTGACVEFVERMLGIPPFNLTRVNPHWLSVYRLFVPSANAGPASGSSSPGRTAFESAIDPVTGVLSVDATRVAAEVNAAHLRLGSTQVPLSELVAPGTVAGYTMGTLLVVLLPPVSTPAAGADAEHLPADGEYHFVATTQNGEWHQVVLRGMAAVLGLGDEFELAGAGHLASADASVATRLPYNLEYFPTPPPTNGSALRWRSLFSPAQLSQPPTVHGKTGAPAAPDVTLPAFPLSADAAELWEGGGGYRTQVYRTARDCMMRRRCGDPGLPLRQVPVGFCPACRRYLQYAIG